MVRRHISQAVRCSLFIVASSIYAFSLVQAQEQADQGFRLSDEALGKITVTGYVVPRVGDGPENVETLDQSDAQKIGAQSLYDLLLRLPANLSTFTAASNSANSFTPGASAVDLRGLGVSNTLTLIDGLRVVSSPSLFSGTDSFSDISSIPLAAIDRTEVLLDGASATYGADAVAGVVNIILKTDYEGAEMGTRYQVTQDGFGAQYRAYALAGLTKHFNDQSKVNLMVGFDYSEYDPIKNSAIAWAREENLTKYGFSNFLSSQPGAAEFVLPDGSVIHTPDGSNGKLAPGNFVAGPRRFQVFNYATYGNTTYGGNLLDRLRNIHGFANVTYDINQYMRAYGSFLYSQNESGNANAPDFISSTDGITVPGNNIYNPFKVPLFVDRINFFNSPISTIFTKTETYRISGGLRLQNLPKNWFVDLRGVGSESTQLQTLTGKFSIPAVNAALSGRLAGFEGRFLNPFVDRFSQRDPDPALTAATQFDALQASRSALDELSISAGGELFDLPGGPITLGGGLEYRDEKAVSINDPLTSHNLTVNFSGRDYEGQRNVFGAYYEVTIPILGEKWSFPGARSLQFVLAERFDRYSDFGSAAKPKFSILYKPLEDLTIRANYAESYRAPSLFEMQPGGSAAFTTVIDFTKNSNDPNFSPFVRLLQTGNQNLKPQTAYSYSLGFIWKPGSFDPEHSPLGCLNGLNLHADVYHYKIYGAISLPDTQFVVDHPEIYPGAVARDASGTISSVHIEYSNIGASSISGVDFGLEYTTKEYNWGKLELSLNGIWQYSQQQQNVPYGKFFDYTRSFRPNLKYIANLFYSKIVDGVDTFQTGLTVNYFGSYESGATWDPTTPTVSHHAVPEWTTFDFQISYEFGKSEHITSESPQPGFSKDGKPLATAGPAEVAKTPAIREWLGGTKLTFGIYNLMDRDPPRVDNVLGQGFDEGVTMPWALGRQFYIALTKKF
jgi:iron complex outermembrane recepter protein